MVSFTAEDCARFRTKGDNETWFPGGPDWWKPLEGRVREIGQRCIQEGYSGPVTVGLHVSQGNQASSKGSIVARQSFCDLYPAKVPTNPAIKMSSHFSMQIYFRLTRFGGEVGLCWGKWLWQGTRSELTDIYEDARDWIRGRLEALPDPIREQLVLETAREGYRFVDSWSEGGAENTYPSFAEWSAVACSERGAQHAIIRTFTPEELEGMGESIEDAARAAVRIFSPLFTHVHHDPSMPATGTELPPSPETGRLGKPYKKAKTDAKSTYRSPIVRDPDAIDRANNSHSALQNELSDFVRSAGYKPLRPNLPKTPNWDLAWYAGSEIFVAEVKSITDDNEKSQLRHGLGQVLHYKTQLMEAGESAVAVLAVEREPPEIWERVCEMADVILVWPGVFKRCFEAGGDSGRGPDQLPDWFTQAINDTDD